jgi:hypothetical protein
VSSVTRTLASPTARFSKTIPSVIWILCIF